MRVTSKKKRIIAAIIDMYIGIALYGIIVGVSIESLNRVSLVDGLSVMIISVILIFIILPMYYAISDYSMKGIGKRIMKICVRHTSGRRVSFLTSIKRGFLKTISLPIILVPLDYMFNKERNTFYDRILDTSVYDRKKTNEQ